MYSMYPQIPESSSFDQQTKSYLKKITANFPSWRICDASSCTEVEAGLEQVVVVKVEEEEEELEQVERLEAVSSCSQQRVGEVCAPVNCKFTTEKQECSTQQNRQQFNKIHPVALSL